MASIYKPWNLYAAQFNPQYCKAAVHDEGRSVHFHQCCRKPWKDGWCKTHHPDEEKKRTEKQIKKYEDKMKHRELAAQHSAWRRVINDLNKSDYPGAFVLAEDLEKIKKEIIK